MTNEQKQRVVEMLGVRAEVSGKVFSTAALVQMTEDMSDLDFVAVIQTLAAWGRTNSTFPHPADIREKVRPEINDKDDAQDVANLIIGAVTRHGYTNALSASKAIGTLGWEVVKRMGGWRHLCETLNHENETTLRAQIREYTNTVKRKAMRGELADSPSLPQTGNVTTLISNTVQKLTNEGAV